MKLYKPFQFLTAAECDELIQYGKDKIQNGTTLGKFAGRNNRIAWYKESKHWARWIEMFNSIEPVIDWIQTPQIAFYQPGEHYDWHVDVGHGDAACRKISISVMLSPDDKYKGGDLEVNDHGVLRQGIREQGSINLFPSYMPHRVAPVTEGERWALVIWINGPDRFK